MKHKSDAFFVGATTAKEVVGDGITRQIFGYNDTVLMARIEFVSGAIGSIHAHPHSQVTYVESGEFDVYVDGVEKRLGRGDGFCAHPNLDHGVVCRKAGVLLDVFSPVRADFLNDAQ